MNLTLENIEILLLIAAVVSMVARALHLPYTIGLVFAGMGVALLPSSMDARLTKDLIFTAFLPPLIFEAAYQMPWRAVRKNLAVTMTLATLGVLVSVAFIAAGVHYLIGWSWPAAVIVGVLMSATDPVSVIATFKDMKVKGRLRLLVEAESLFNDGTAVVLFGVAMAALAGGAVTTGFVLKTFAVTVLGGILCGALVAAAILFLAGRTTDHLEEITLTTIAAYGSFLLGEHLHVSGVLATLTAGILVGNVGPLGAISPRGREAVESFWEYAGFVANSLIFLLIGIGMTHETFRGTLVSIAVVIVLATLGRAAAVYGCCTFFRGTRHAVTGTEQHVLFWGGLRGALSLALALSLPADMPHRDAIRTVTFAAVAFSVIVQGLSLIPLLRHLNVIPPRGATPETETETVEAAGGGATPQIESGPVATLPDQTSPYRDREMF